jgi:hypothetical protein
MKHVLDMNEAEHIDWMRNGLRGHRQYFPPLLRNMPQWLLQTLLFVVGLPICLVVNTILGGFLGMSRGFLMTLYHVKKSSQSISRMDLGDLE